MIVFGVAGDVGKGVKKDGKIRSKSHSCRRGIGGGVEGKRGEGRRGEARRGEARGKERRGEERRRRRTRTLVGRARKLESTQECTTVKTAIAR